MAQALPAEASAKAGFRAQGELSGCRILEQIKIRNNLSGDSPVKPSMD